MIVADTGAVLALLDRSDRHHAAMVASFEERPDAWILPWAILPEVDYLAATHLGNAAQDAFLADLADGDLRVDWGAPADLPRAHEIARRYRDLRLGLVDTVVMAIAERRRATAIATLDLRHFSAVRLKTQPRLLPRDL